MIYLFKVIMKIKLGNVCKMLRNNKFFCLGFIVNVVILLYKFFIFRISDYIWNVVWE